MKTNFDIVYNRKGTYSTQWDYIEARFGEKDLLPFSISDTDFPVPEPVRMALLQRVGDGIFGYTRWNHEDFQDAVSGWYQHSFGCRIDPSQLVYSPSVIYTIAKIILQVTKEGDQIVTQTPAYDAFYKVVKDNGRTLSENKLIDTDDGYQIDFEDLAARLKRPEAKVLLLCSPHNPTGRVWTRMELQEILHLCRKYGTFIISDEIHMDILRGGQTQIPITAVSEGYEKLCLCTSASKTFNTPGLIGSYALIADAEVREDFLLTLKNRDGLSSASILGMEALMTAYNQCRSWKDELNQYVDGNLDYIFQFCEKNLPGIRFRVPQATYLAWMDLNQYEFTMDQLQELLVHKYKTAIMPGGIYGIDYGNFLRMNAGCPRSKLVQGMEALKKAVNDLERIQ